MEDRLGPSGGSCGPGPPDLGLLGRLLHCRVADRQAQISSPWAGRRSIRRVSARRPGSRARTTAAETPGAPGRATVEARVEAAPTAVGRRWSDARARRGCAVAGSGPARSSGRPGRDGAAVGSPSRGSAYRTERCASGRTGGCRPARPGPGRAQQPWGRPAAAHSAWAGACGRGSRSTWTRRTVDAHDRSGSSAAVAGVALLLGMQPSPRLDGHGAVLVVLTDQRGGRGGPGGRVGEVELGAVATRPACAARGPWWRVGVETAAGAQPHQHGRGDLGRSKVSWAES